MSTGSSATGGQAVVVDTSVWVSSLLPGDTNHLPALSWLNAHVNSGGLIIAPLIFPLETGAAVARLTRNENFAASAVSDLYLSTYVSLRIVDEALINEATEVAVTYKLRGADAIYVALAHRLAIPLVTFDNEQLTRPAGIIATIRP
jgi:predicted nucleic acid-binding protein